MALVDQLFVATYNGVRFYIDSSDMNYGRKTQTFEYPNKKHRTIEDLGENLKTFQVNAIITGDDDYLVSRELFILALQRKGTGILTHPFYGLVFVAVKDYTVTEDTSTIGECRFRIIFEEVRENIFPVSGEESIATITGLINEIAPYLEAAFITTFTTSFKRNVLDTANKCDKLNSSLQPKRPVYTEYNVWDDFSEKTKEFDENKYDLIQDSSAFAPAISDLLNSYNNLGKTDEESYILNSEAYYFGNDDIFVKQTTAERKQRVDNRRIYNDFVNATLLMNLYSNALQITYLDDQQIAEKEKELEEKYQYLIKDTILDIEIIRRLENLRNVVKRFYNKLKVNVSKVISVNIPKTPLTVLLYRYYANFDNEDEVIALNDLTNVSKISGDIRILTEAST